MATTCNFPAERQIFNGDAQIIAADAISAVATHGNSTTETAIYTSSSLSPSALGTDTNFRLTLGGVMSSDGTDDVALQLMYGTTDILAVTTVTLIDEDDDRFELVFTGRILTAGASGKIVAGGICRVDQATPLTFTNVTAAAGVSVDLTASGAFSVTADWDGAAATSTLTVLYGFLELFA